MSTFIEYKQTLEAQLQEKKRLLEEGAKEHDTHVSDLERKHVQEKDRLKKEMLLKLRETKANLLKMTDNQLDTTTKRTIAENEQMSAELAWQVHTGRPPSAHRPPHAPCAHPACTLRAPCAHPARTLRAPCAHSAACSHAPGAPPDERGVLACAQSKETEKLIRKNDKLVADNHSLKRALSLHEQTEEEFARKARTGASAVVDPCGHAPCTHRVRATCTRMCHVLPEDDVPTLPCYLAAGARLPEDHQDTAGQARRDGRQQADRAAAAAGRRRRA